MVRKTSVSLRFSAGAVVLLLLAGCYPRPDPAGDYILRAVGGQALPYVIALVDQGNRQEIVGGTLHIAGSEPTFFGKTSGSFERRLLVDVYVDGAKTEEVEVTTGTYDGDPDYVTFHADGEWVGEGTLDGDWLLWSLEDGTQMDWELQ